jgi:hypothetical protein
MSWDRSLIVILASIGMVVYPVSVRAEQFRSIDQWPGLIDQDDGSVRIANIGAAALNISYLDGIWKSIPIPSGQYVTLPSQRSGLSVSFHDGATQQSATLNSGSIYALYWNSGSNRWAIAPYDDVAKRPTIFRSR